MELSCAKRLDDVEIEVTVMFMFGKKKKDETPADPNNEAGSIGDEQMPMGENIKTDKRRWTLAADKVAKDDFLPPHVREFLNGL